ncbi:MULTISPECIES: PRC-barrel domain-containing protein [Prochlorococcus]|uniref:PRC-barrel domain-containing protein n=1 Tax=Prochlorococcus TaxID=1218 RepID=UPI0005338F8F|nr:MULTISPECIES: PRC-barrel domain-containing protein [Prochlorococcus]KGG13325.1 Protein implicated in RNA metabolism (PRC-barrel domain) [Prochlorococcus sp. MIT 0601]
MTNTQFPSDSSEAIPTDRLWLRAELMGTQVITTDTGRRLGVVGEVVVDIDRREVIALGLRDNPLTRFLPGLPKWMLLDRIRQVGDVILVDSIDSLSENFESDRYSKVINCQVITESGEQLGRVLGFSFDIETGELISLVMGALGVPLLGEGVLSTWEIPVDEIVSSGADRIIVYEGAEEKLKQLSSGLLEKLGVGGTSWEERERERYRVNLVPVENQLSSGEDLVQEQKVLQASSQEVFQEEEQELEYVELEDSNKFRELKSRYLEDPIPTSTDQYNEYYEDDIQLGQYNEEYRSASKKRNINDQPINEVQMQSRRAIQNNDELLDVEPMEENSLENTEIPITKDQSILDNHDSIEDPW